MGRDKSAASYSKTGKRDRPQKDDQRILNGMLWIVRIGTQWRELPETYDPWQSVYARFAKWRGDGILEAMFCELSTCIKVHESANGGENSG